MDRLTPRQSEVVRFCRRYADKHGYPPTLRELADGLSVSVNAIVGHLAAAAKKGAITRSARPRSDRPKSQPSRTKICHGGMRRTRNRLETGERLSPTRHNARTSSAERPWSAT